MLTHEEWNTVSNREVDSNNGSPGAEKEEANPAEWGDPHHDVPSPPFLSTLFSSGAPDDVLLGEGEEHPIRMGEALKDGGDGSLLAAAAPPLPRESHPLWTQNTPEHLESSEVRAGTGPTEVEHRPIVPIEEKRGCESQEKGEGEVALLAPLPSPSFSSSAPSSSPLPPLTALPAPHSTGPSRTIPLSFLPPPQYSLSSFSPSPPPPPPPSDGTTEVLSPVSPLEERERGVLPFGTSRPSNRPRRLSRVEEAEAEQDTSCGAPSSPVSGGFPYSPVVVPVVERFTEDRRARCCSCHMLLFSRSFSDAVTEALGTFFLVFSVPLSAAVVGELAPFAVGFMLLSMILAMGYLSGGHFNPAISFAVWLCSPEATSSDASSVVVDEGVRGGHGGDESTVSAGGWGAGGDTDSLPTASSPPTFPFSKLIVYVVAQLIGGFLASVYAFIVVGGGSMSIPLYSSETGEWNNLYLIIRVILTEAMYTFLMCSVPLHIGGSALLSSMFPMWEKEGEKEEEETNDDDDDEEEEAANDTRHVDGENVEMEEGSGGRREKEEEDVVVVRGSRRSTPPPRSLSSWIAPLRRTAASRAKEKKKKSMTSYDLIKASFQPHHLCGFGVAFALMAGQFAGGTISAGVFNPAVYTSLSVTRCVLTFTADNCGKPMFALWIYWLGELLGSVVASMAYVGLLHLRKTSREEDEEAKIKKIEKRKAKKWRKKKAMEEEARRDRQRKGERQWAEDSLRELFEEEDTSRNRGVDKRRA